MNNVSLIGSLVGDPQLVVGRDGGRECVMQIEVPRRALRGEREPGVIYVDVTAFGDQARACAEELAAGLRVGVSGMLAREDSLDRHGPRRSRWQVYAHQVDIIDPPPPDAA
jgi:single-stranded DNA-binding protein